jgi:hypothetical protein
MLHTLPYLYAIEKSFNVADTVVLNHTQLPSTRANQKRWVDMPDGSCQLDTKATFPDIRGVARPNGDQWEGSVYYDPDETRVIHEARPSHIRTIKARVERLALDIVALSILQYRAFTPMDAWAFYVAVGNYRRETRGVKLTGAGIAVNTLAQRLADFGLCYMYQSDNEVFYLAFAPNMSRNDLLMVFLLNHEPSTYPTEIIRYGSGL